MTRNETSAAQPQSEAEATPSSMDVSLRLQKLELESFRGFAHLTIELPEQGPAVFIGINGCGKSSILDAIAMPLQIWAGYVAGIYDESDVANYDYARTTEFIEHKYIDTDSSDIQDGKSGTEIIVCVRSNGREGRWAFRLLQGKSTQRITENLIDHAYGCQARLQESTINAIPVLCYYPATRGLRGKSSENTIHNSIPFGAPEALNAYNRAFAEGIGPFGNFVRWFRDEEDAENEKRLRDDNAYRNPRLEVIRRALQTFLETLNGAHYTNMRMERLDTGRRVRKVAELVIDKDGVRLSITQLSEGERNTLMLVADLASRLGIANPGKDDPLQGNGVVLIDEVDLHLHPAWQRELLPALCKTFRGCQFIVTTHSPQVLGRVPKDNVFILENFNIVKNRPHTYGRDANSILGEVMGVPERPKDIEEMIRNASRLVDEERLDEAKIALEKLSSAVGDDDHMVVRIRTLMSFLGQEN